MTHSPRKLRMLVLAGASIVLGSLILSSNLGAYIARTNRPDLALSLPMASGAANAAWALYRAQNGGTGDTVTLPAARATLRSPLHWRAFIASALVLSDPKLNDQLRDHAVALTRRDPAAVLERYYTRNAVGDMPGAVAMLDAYLRVTQRESGWERVIWRRIDDASFSAEIAARLAAMPSWRPRFFSIAAAAGPDPAAVDRLWRALARRGAPVTRVEAAPLLARLSRDTSNNSAAGYRLWLRHFAAGPLAPPPVDAPPLAYDWQRLADDGTVYQARDAFPARATKLIVLVPGTYRLTVPNEGDVRWSLDCAGESAVARSLSDGAVLPPRCVNAIVTLFSNKDLGDLRNISLVQQK